MYCFLPLHCIFSIFCIGYAQHVLSPEEMLPAACQGIIIILFRNQTNPNYTPLFMYSALHGTHAHNRSRCSSGHAYRILSRRDPTGRLSGHRNIILDKELHLCVDVCIASCRIHTASLFIFCIGHAQHVLSPEEMLPAACQGIVCAVCRKNDTDLLRLLHAIDDQEVSMP